MKKIFKILLGIILAAFILIQFYPGQNNNVSPGVGVHDINMVHNVPSPVQQILKTSCYDCHSNNTAYPWYAHIQPVSMWLADHIKDGKRELNFSEFGAYELRRQYHKLEEIGEQVEASEMPLSSYTIIHKDAKLDDIQKKAISVWTTALMDSFRSNYPVDSLERKKR